MATEDHAKQYKRWKTLIPFLYDWFNNHNLSPWPSLVCRWGPVLEQHTYKTKQRLYISERTDDTGVNTLIVCNADIVKPRVALAEHIAKFHEEVKSAFVKKHKNIPHPGEVNKIRELPQHPNLLITHTDAPELYVWNVETQPGCDKLSKGVSPARPDLTLVGHEDNAEFALSTSALAPRCCSGGKDKLVCIWDLQDHVNTLLASRDKEGGDVGRQSWNSGGSGGGSAPVATLDARIKFEGHKDTVEGVQFHPNSAEELCSVGDDKALLFWDARSGTTPVLKVAKAHNKDVHCVDWCPMEDWLVVTGSADHTLRLFDRRKLSNTSTGKDAMHTFQSHTGPITTVEWVPQAKGFLASGAEDSRLNVWDCNRIGARQLVDERRHGPPELIFQHAGHRSPVVDFQWNPHAPWTMVSVSDNMETEDGGSDGGTLQMWRMSDLIYRPEREVLAELENTRAAITGTAKSAKPSASKPDGSDDPKEEAPEPEASGKVMKVAEEGDVKAGVRAEGASEAPENDPGPSEETGDKAEADNAVAMEEDKEAPAGEGAGEVDAPTEAEAADGQAAEPAASEPDDPPPEESDPTEQPPAADAKPIDVDEAAPPADQAVSSESDIVLEPTGEEEAVEVDSNVPAEGGSGEGGEEGGDATMEDA